MIQKVSHCWHLLIKRLTRLFKTDMAYLIHGSSWLFGGQAISSALSLVVTIAFANLVSKEIYGQYKYFTTAFSLLTIMMGLDLAATRAVARGFEGSVWPTFKAKVTWGLAGSAAGLVLGLWYFVQGNYILASGMVAVALFVPITDSLTITQAYLIGRKEFREVTIYTSISKIIQSISILVAVYFSNNAVIILVSALLSLTIIRILLSWRLLRRFKPNTRVEPRVVGYGTHLSITSIISSIANQLDKVAIFHYLGPVQLAIFTIAMAPSEQMKSIFKHLATLAMPKLSILDLDHIKKIIGKKILLASLGGGLISLIYILLAPVLFHVFLPSYNEAIGYSQWIAASLLTLPGLWLIQTIFQSQRLTKQVYHATITNGVIQIILTLGLIIYFGLPGAIAARILFRFITLWLNWRLLQKSQSVAVHPITPDEPTNTVKSFLANASDE